MYAVALGTASGALHLPIAACIVLKQMVVHVYQARLPGCITLPACVGYAAASILEHVTGEWDQAEVVMFDATVHHPCILSDS